jgi:hypothetical protein
MIEHPDHEEPRCPARTAAPRVRIEVIEEVARNNPFAAVIRA